MSKVMATWTIVNGMMSSVEQVANLVPWNLIVILQCRLSGMTEIDREAILADRLDQVASSARCF